MHSVILVFQSQEHTSNVKKCKDYLVAQAVLIGLSPAALQGQGYGGYGQGAGEILQLQILLQKEQELEGQCSPLISFELAMPAVIFCLCNTALVLANCSMHVFVRVAPGYMTCRASHD